MSPFSIIFVFAILLVVPAILIFSLWRGPFHSRLDWLIQLLFTSMFMIWIFFAGSWDWVGYYFRYVWIVLFILVLFPSWKKAQILPARVSPKKGTYFSRVVNIVLVLIFGMYNVFVFSSLSTDDEAIALSFPLQGGTYYVGHGGNHPQMNYHNAYPDQKYALDIVKLNAFGIRASGIHPKNLEKYAIYGDVLYSPCHGKVLEAVGDLPDQIPPATDPENATGNYVALECENEEATLYMAHMKENSVLVEEGDLIQAGEEIGVVGNSGNTSEPHLHIHAEIDGEGVPIQFGGKFLVRNQLVKSSYEERTLK